MDMSPVNNSESDRAIESGINWVVVKVLHNETDKVSRADKEGI